MAFWSEWLRVVTRARASERPTPAAESAHPPAHPAAHPAAPADRRAVAATRAPHERASDRLVVPAADRAPAPATPTLVAADALRTDLALASRPGTAAQPPADEMGQWHARLFDVVSDGVLLFGTGGELAYRNAAAAAMTDDEGFALLREARALALAVLARTGSRAAGADAARELTVGAVHFRLTALPIPPSFPPASLAPTSREPVVLVAIARTSPPLPSVEALRHRFQLTAREASVALLLAEGRSNAGVARRLGISANTVRHYIETVLLKLDVPSRAAVAAALLGVYEHTDEHQLPRIARVRRSSQSD